MNSLRFEIMASSDGTTGLEAVASCVKGRRSQPNKPWMSSYCDFNIELSVHLRVIGLADFSTELRAEQFRLHALFCFELDTPNKHLQHAVIAVIRLSSAQ